MRLRVTDSRSGPRLCEPQQRRRFWTGGFNPTHCGWRTRLRVADSRSVVWSRPKRRSCDQPVAIRELIAFLELGASLELGVWDLELLPPSAQIFQRCSNRSRRNKTEINPWLSLRWRVRETGISRGRAAVVPPCWFSRAFSVRRASSSRETLCLHQPRPFRLPPRPGGKN
jgi:hypothetical protein